MNEFLNAFDFSKDTSLYIHVPFCISKCSYCAFYSLTGCSASQMDGYTERIVTEICTVNGRMEGRPYITAFIGGGNPGCLGPERLGRIAEAVCQNGRPSEFTTEMNPESLDESFFPLFESFFTRLSMGVQSLDSKALDFLGRNASRDETLRGLDLSQRLHSLCGTDLSYDLITCLGFWHDELSDVHRLTAQYPTDHLSVYALTLEEGTPLYRNGVRLPSADEQYGMLKRIWNYLEDQGFEHYEVSNFAKDGHRSRHNCRYWDYRQYVGLGPGAASTAFRRNGGVTRFIFETRVSGYAEGRLFSGYETETLSKREALEELVFMGLRYKGGVDLSRLKIDVDILPRMDGFVFHDGHLVPTDDGMMVADAYALSIIEKL